MAVMMDDWMSWKYQKTPFYCVWKYFSAPSSSPSTSLYSLAEPVHKMFMRFTKRFRNQKKKTAPFAKNFKREKAAEAPFSHCVHDKSDLV